MLITGNEKSKMDGMNGTIEHSDAGGFKSGRMLENADLESLIAIAAVSLTVASQFYEGLTLIFFGCWALLLALGIAAGGKRLVFKGYARAFVLLSMGYAPILLILGAVSGVNEYLTGFYLLLLKTLFMYLVGYCLSCFPRADRLWKAILVAYFVSCAIYAIWMMVAYFPGLDIWLAGFSYLFKQKNSAGQILGVACLLSILFADRLSCRGRMIAYSYALVLFVIVTLMQCRTAMLGCIAALAYLLLIKKRYTLLLLVVVAAVSVYLLSPEVQALVDHALFIDKYDSASLDAMSSGRLGLWSEAIIIFNESPLFGNGNYYVDNFYIDALANLGIIGAIVFFSLWFTRIVINYRGAGERRSGNPSYMQLSLREAVCRYLPILSVFYIVESLFEGYPPFGPGSCAFIFWMMCGFSDASHTMVVGSRSSRRVVEVISK